MFKSIATLVLCSLITVAMFVIAFHSEQGLVFTLVYLANMAITSVGVVAFNKHFAKDIANDNFKRANFWYMIWLVVTSVIYYVTLHYFVSITEVTLLSIGGTLVYMVAHPQGLSYEKTIQECRAKQVAKLNLDIFTK